MTKLESHLTGKAIVAHLANEERILIVQIEIDCPGCGQQQFWVAGHHLRALRNMLVEFIDLHPDLTGDEAGMKVINRMQFTGQGNDPTNS